MTRVYRHEKERAAPLNRAPTSSECWPSMPGQDLQPCLLYLHAISLVREGSRDADDFDDSGVVDAAQPKRCCTGRLGRVDHLFR